MTATKAMRRRSKLCDPVSAPGKVSFHVVHNYATAIEAVNCLGMTGSWGSPAVQGGTRAANYGDFMHHIDSSIDALSEMLAEGF